jgi:hypothetical protein
MTIVAEPYGRDTSATTRIHRGRVVSGARLLAEAAFRRLVTERGTLLDDPNYGFAVKQFLNADMTPARRAAAPGLIRLELQKDDRIVSGSIRVDITEEREPNGSLSWTIDVAAVGVDEGPFEFSVSVDEVTVELLDLPEVS